MDRGVGVQRVGVQGVSVQGVGVRGRLIIPWSLDEHPLPPQGVTDKLRPARRQCCPVGGHHGEKYGCGTPHCIAVLLPDQVPLALVQVVRGVCRAKGQRRVSIGVARCKARSSCPYYGGYFTHQSCPYWGRVRGEHRYLCTAPAASQWETPPLPPIARRRGDGPDTTQAAVSSDGRQNESICGVCGV